MKLTKILEDAAVGSISTAGIAANPFTHSPPKKRKLMRRKTSITESSIAKFNIGTAILYEYDMPTDGRYDSTIDSTNDKVTNAIKQSQVDDKFATSSFGLQDGDGNVIKVTVKRDQASDFEARLNTLLSDVDNPKEIAEVLYLLKQDYDILDVEWNEPITEDDEEPQPEGEGEADLGDEDLALDADGEIPPDGEEDLAEPSESPDLQAGTVDLLQQVINLLKSETEARTANAKVATADAETKLADIEQQKQEQEIGQQQEIADMEEFEAEEKENKKNERLVARLAKYRAAKQGS